MICKDCIHFDVCKDATVPNPEYKGVQPDKSKECRHFKNKTDYAEVKHGHWVKHSPDVAAMRAFHKLGIGKGMSETVSFGLVLVAIVGEALRRNIVTNAVQRWTEG